MRIMEAIRLVNQKRKILQRINEFRKLDNPPISGLDALLVSQIALNHNIHSFISAGEKLITDLEDRTKRGLSAYAHNGPRVMVADMPSPMGFSEVPRRPPPEEASTTTEKPYYGYPFLEPA
jgi:benzoyl-CoA reductase/2-hydroxyglutaryl-CoA dehydratase subunit BcrC/BadD/HgdB